MRILLHAALMLILATPALADEGRDVTLHIQPPTSIDWHGNNLPISLQVEDARSDAVPGDTTEGKPLRLRGDLAAMIRAAVSEALKLQDYRLLPEKDAALSLKLRIRSLHYDVTENLFSSDVTVRAAIEASVKRGDKTLTKQLQGRNDYEVALTPSMKRNSEMISETVSNAVNAIFADPDIAALLRP